MSDNANSTSIYIGSDHAGLDLKLQIIDFLNELGGYDVTDAGTHGRESCDYPDYARPVAEAVADGRAYRGILVCSTGIGMSMAANKVNGIRAALVHHAYEARMTRMHNDANILCLGANITGRAIAVEAVRAFLETPFEGGRHRRRVEKVMDIENGMV